MHFWKFHFLTKTGSEWQWLIPLTVGHVRCIEAGEWNGEERTCGARSSGIANGIQCKGWECNRAEGWRGVVGNRALGQPLSLWQRPSWGFEGSLLTPGRLFMYFWLQRWVLHLFPNMCRPNKTNLPASCLPGQGEMLKNSALCGQIVRVTLSLPLASQWKPAKLGWNPEIQRNSSFFGDIRRFNFYFVIYLKMEEEEKDKIIFNSMLHKPN